MMNLPAIPITLPVEIETWLRNPPSKETQRAYRSDLLQFLAWLGKSLPQATILDVIRYRESLVEAGRSAATISRKLAVVGNACAVLVDTGLMSRNPATPKAVKRPSVPQESPRNALDDRIVMKLLDSVNRETIQGKRDYAILMILCRLALRRAEVAALNIGSFARDRGFTVVLVKGKGQKVRHLPVPDEVLAAITDYIESSGRQNESPEAPLFVTVRNSSKPKGGRITPEGVWNVVTTHAAAAGIETDVHTLRHTAASNALDNQATLDEIQDFLGHANITTTRRYARKREKITKSAAWKVRYE